MCSLPVKAIQGIFCGNFCYSRGAWDPCRSAWHEECYTCLGKGIFPVRKIVDEAGNPWHKDAQRIHHLNTGVKGVHCSLPFQCEVCWMRNLEYRNPSIGDDAYVMTLRRANLDAMAGKARGTINDHRLRTLELVRNAERINKTPTLEPRGPFPLKDQVGMA